MPRKPTPYFQVYAAELLTDEKIEELSDDELGKLLRLWSKMWVNGVERGTLLREPGVPISDDKIAEFLRISSDKWVEIERRLVSEVKVLRRGQFGELYSKRLRNFKTKWELYHPEKESKKTRKRKIPDKNSTIALASSLASSSASSKDKIKDKIFVELFNSTCPSLPKIASLSKSRTDKIRLRLKEHPNSSWWEDVFRKVQATPFLRGDNDRGWKATFDWLMKNDQNALKVAEGHYEHKQKSHEEKALERERMGKDS